MTVPGYAKNVLVDADWAVQHIDDPNIRFVEVDVDTAAYDEGHIPGAVAWNWTSQLSDGAAARHRQPRGPGQAAERVGHRPGHDDRALRRQQQLVRRLGVLAAQAVRRREREDPQRRAQVLARREPADDDRRPELRADRHRAADRRLQPSRLPRRRPRADRRRTGALVDVRSPAEFNGELLAPAALPQEGAQRAGHVPGAANIPWGQAVNEDGTFKAADELRELYAREGHHRRTRTSSPTAASASAPATPGSCSTSCSASTASATTTARGPSTAASSACRSRSPSRLPRPPDWRARRSHAPRCRGTRGSDRSIALGVASAPADAAAFDPPQ